MNIYTNYSVNYLRFNQRLNNQQQTMPQEIKSPAFKMNKKAMLVGATALGVAIEGGIKAAENMKAKNEPQIPTRDEFRKMTKNVRIPYFYREKVLQRYDEDAENAVAFLNLIRQIVDAEDDNGLQIFSTRAAYHIAEKNDKYSKGLTKMLNMRDDFGNFRFKYLNDFVAAEVFEKYPEEAEKYANLKDDMGNYRFDGYKIDEIVKAKAKGIHKPEDIDNILNLKRKDGSYVFDALPGDKIIKLYKEEPEMFSEICNIRTPNRNKYVDGNYVCGLMEGYRNYPEETKKLLQMADKNSAIFSENEIVDNNIAAQRIYKNAPKTFMALATLKRGEFNEDGFRFNLSDIVMIIYRLNDFKLSELSKEDIKAVNELAKIRTRTEDRDDYPTTAEEIIKAFGAYREHPAETKEIIKQYSTEDEYGEKESLIPSKEDVEMYINNRAEFDKKYQKWEDIK